MHLVTGTNYFSFTSMAQTGFDRRRINGPEESFQPIFLTKPDNNYTPSKDYGPRNGRKASDIRPICE
jgi:exosome complex component MTR3